MSFKRLTLFMLFTCAIVAIMLQGRAAGWFGDSVLVAMPHTALFQSVNNVSMQATPPPTVGSNPNACAPYTGPVPKKTGDEALSLQKSLIKTTRDWGYMRTFTHHWRSLKGLHVLDIGMGQGPMGVLAMSLGIASYTGLDPALCVERHALTRVQKPPYRDNFRTFPFTGLDMMAAFEGRIRLLAGTFESLQGTGLIKRGMFDMATMWSSSEHFDDFRTVLEGAAQYLAPGQILRIHHANYYSYDGHHERPFTPKEFQRSNPSHVEVAQWRHLDPESPPAKEWTLNRVRLGDLIALIDIYFECAWRAWGLEGQREGLMSEPGLRESLESRGFSVAELIPSRWSGACARREDQGQGAKQAPPWLATARFHHPPLDGSYTPQKLPEVLTEQLRNKGYRASFTPRGMKALEKYFFWR